MKPIIFNLTKPVPENFIDIYAYGNCMCLATALHRKYGLEIQVALSLDNGIEYIDHAWVFDSADGMIIDVDGRYAPERNGFVNPSNRVVSGLDEAALLAIIHVYHNKTTAIEWESLISEAHSFIDEYFA